MQTEYNHDVYRMIQNNLLTLKGHILGRILRQFFLYENFVRSLVFKLQEEIVYTRYTIFIRGSRIENGQERRSRLDVRGVHWPDAFMFIKTCSFFSLLLLSFLYHIISLSLHTLNMLISLNYKLEWILEIKMDIKLFEIGLHFNYINKIREMS